MGLIQTTMGAIKKMLRNKSIDDANIAYSGTQFGGIELLTRLTGGSWNKTKMLSQYEKSLYVFACVDMISKKVAATQSWLYLIKNSKGDTEEILSHPIIDLMDRPNPFQDHDEFFKITSINLNLCGDAFWFKVRNERGDVVELWNLRPDYVEIVKDPELFIKAYKFHKGDGTTEVLMPDDVVHFRMPTPLSDYEGTSAIKSANVRIDTENYASLYQRDFFLNNARPDGIIKANVGANLTEEQKNEIREEFERRHKGVGKNSRLAVLEGDIAYQQISISQREMDFIESLKFTRDDILVAFHMPKILVSVTDDVNRATAETGMNIFLSEMVDPQNQLLWKKINEQLVASDFDEALFFVPDQQAKKDRATVLADYESGLKNSYLTINEVRAEENRAPIEGGDVLYMPLNLVPIGGLTQETREMIRNKYEERQKIEAERARRKVFEGRGLLYKKLALKEEMVKQLNNEFKINTVENLKIIREAQKSLKAKVGKKTVGLIQRELREQYADMIIKAIDQRAKTMKSAVDRQAAEQQNKLLAILSDKITKDLKSKGMSRELKNTIKEFYNEESAIWAEFAFPFITEFLQSSAVESLSMVNPQKTFNLTPAIQIALKARAKQFGLEVNQTTRERINEAISAGLEAGEGMIQISDRISSVYQDFPLWRSDLIARTESTAANNEGMLEAYRQSEVATHKEWIATKDDRTRPEHMALDGEIVKIDELFSNGLKYPSEPNCRCVIGPAME